MDTRIRSSLAALAALLFATDTALAVDGVIEINQTSVLAAGGFPFTIPASGSYVLTSNLTPPPATSALVVGAADVTLDLNGFSLIGAGGPGGSGVSVAGFIGLTIRNGSITGFDGAGILASGGLKLFQTHIFLNTGTGVAGAECLIVENTIEDNGANGIDAFDCKIENNVITGNAMNGISGPENVIVHNKIADNGAVGPGGGILSFAGSTIQENVLLSNANYGVSDTPGAPPGPVPMPPAPGIGFPPGPPIGTSPNNIMKNVITSAGVAPGIGVFTRDSALITDNVVTGWTLDGIVCSTSCTIRGNQVHTNNITGASNGGITAGPGSTVHANSVSFNTGVGLVLAPTTGYSNNVFDGNLLQDVSMVVPIGPPSAAPNASAGFDNLCSGAPGPVPGFGPGTCP